MSDPKIQEDTKIQKQSIDQCIEFVDIKNDKTIKFQIKPTENKLIKYIDNEEQKTDIRTMYYYPSNGKIIDDCNQQTHYIGDEDKANTLRKLQLFCTNNYLSELFVENESFIEFVDAQTHKQIIITSIKGALIQTVDGKQRPDKQVGEYIVYYKSSGVLQDIYKGGTYYVCSSKRTIVSKTLQLWMTQNLINFKYLQIDGVYFKKRCKADHGELVFMTKHQLNRNNYHNDNRYRVIYNCRECEGDFTVNVGAFSCAHCLETVCISCYFGPEKLHFKCNKKDKCDGNILNAHIGNGTCDGAGCYRKFKDESVGWECIPCGEYILCTECYTKRLLLVCNDCHPLSLYNKDELLDSDEAYKSGFYACTKCEQLKPIAYGAYHCSICNYNVCSVCRNKTEKNRGTSGDILNDGNKCYCCSRNDAKQMQEPQLEITIGRPGCYCDACKNVLLEPSEYGMKDTENLYHTINDLVVFKDKYTTYMPPALMLYTEQRFGWCFAETIQERKEDHVVYVKAMIDHIQVDENFETESSVCSISVKLLLFWLFDENDYDNYWQKTIELERKIRSKYEVDRPWEPQIECIAPATVTSKQTKEDRVFHAIPIWQMFGDHVLKEKSEISKCVGYMQSTENEMVIEVEEPLELQSYPFDEQDVPIVLEAQNFAKFIPALNFRNDNTKTTIPVFEVSGDAVSSGNWNVSAVLGEFATINNVKDGHPTIQDLKKNQMSIRIKFKRRWKWVLVQYAFTVGCVTLLSLATFVFDTDDIASKLGLITGLILTLIFIDLPSIPIFSVLHKYYYISFLYLVFMAFISAFYVQTKEATFDPTESPTNEPTFDPTTSPSIGVTSDLSYNPTANATSDNLEQSDGFILDTITSLSIAIFVLYHLIFIIWSIKIAFNEHKKVSMTTKEIKKNVEQIKDGLTIKSTSKNEMDLFDNETTGISTEIPSFLCNLRKRKNRSNYSQPMTMEPGRNYSLIQTYDDGKEEVEQ